MEITGSSAWSQEPQQTNFPPGFRFHPTDEELVVHYLVKKAVSAPITVAIIAEVDLYKFEPWELPAKATFGEQEWYFFSPRDRKYLNGARPNRATVSGYWKATGTDKPVLTSGGTQKVGVKKALVFYRGKPPKGIKTNWIMHEYRLAENKANNRPPGCDLGNKKNTLRLDDWVLSRISRNNSVKSTGGFSGLLECSKRNGMPRIQLRLSDKDNYQDFEANLNPRSSSLLLDVPALQHFDTVEPSVASDSLFPKENPREADPKHVTRLLPESSDQNEKCPDLRPRLEPAEMFDDISLGSLAANETSEERHATGEKTVNVPNISLNDSVKSTGVADRSTGGAGSKRDWAWKYCSSIPGNSNGVICSFCDLEIKGGGITRFKSHISGSDPSKNVKKCENIPSEVKAEIDQNAKKRR